MKAGVLQFFSWPERRGELETVYERALERIEIMDKTGYDAVWLAEHHFSTYSVCPSVHLMGMHIAGRTKNLRIGTAVQLAARITDRAEPGQVLVSRVVRDLCAGKTFTFTSVGDATLKGFDEPVALYEVRTR